MRGLAYAAISLAALAITLPARGAEITRVMSSFDPDQPFGFDLQVGYERTQRRALINREHHQNGTTEDVAELRFTEIDQRLPIRVAVGLWHDLELHAQLPIVLGDDRTWGYPGLGSDGLPVTTNGNSTAHNNCISARGDYDCGQNRSLYSAPGNAYRTGVGDLTLGMAFALLSQKRDDTKPTWVIGFDYAFPLAGAIDPSLPTTPDQTGPVGDKVHRFTPYMAMSKRVGALDPYVKIEAMLPHVAPGYYSNCDHKSTEPFAENCGQGPWDRRTTGEQAPYTGTATFGAEFWAYDDPGKHQSLTIDLRGEGTFVSQGRYYNELSDALGRQLFTEQYMHVGGTLGINARAAQYVQLKLAATYFHDTDHFLTGENIGQDLNGNAVVDLPGAPETLDANHELNPNYDFAYDGVGRRFRITQVNIFTVMATGELTF